MDNGNDQPVSAQSECIGAENSARDNMILTSAL